MKAFIIIVVWLILAGFLCMFNHGAHRNDPKEQDNS